MKSRGVTFTCQNCGTAFVVRPCEIEKGQGKHCSKACHIASQKKRKMDDAECLKRFWSHVDKNGDVPIHRPELGNCWNWTGYVGTNGRGSIFFKGKYLLSSRAAWSIHSGQLDIDLCVLHHCDNGKCVRPSHLHLGTRQDNMREMNERGRNGMLGNGHLVRGELAGNAKLTWDDIRVIRKDFKDGVSAKALGVKFGVVHDHIYSIVRHKVWKTPASN